MHRVTSANHANLFQNFGSLRPLFGRHYAPSGSVIRSIAVRQIIEKNPNKSIRATIRAVPVHLMEDFANGARF